jgi:ubiquitin carboxyl-terminal hydrolase 1
VHSLVGAHAQQDAHELFVLLLDALESDARAVAAESEARRHAQRGLLALTAAEVGKGADSRASPSLMDGVPSANALPFRGLIAQRTACATCGYVEAIRHQEVDELSLSVSESRAAAGVGYGGISLEQCLQVWGALERIEWGCWRCSLVAEHERLRSDVARLEGELASAAPSTSASGKKATKATQRRRRLLREESTALALVTDALKSNAHEGDLSLPPTLKVPRVYSRCATKQVLLARPPPLLAIHLNRSDYSASSFGARKSSTPVGFGEWLDVAPFSTHGKLDVDPCRPLAPAQATRQKGLRHWYRLQSIVVHYGAHAFGHYVAYRRLPAAASQPHAADNWARISDDSVQRTSLREVLAQQDSVVLLFYARGDTLGDLVHDTSHVSVSSSTAGRKSAPASNGHSFAHASGAADDTQTRAQRSPSEESAYTPRVVHSWNSAAFLPAAGLQGLSGADVPTPGEDATMPRDAASSSLNGSVTPAPGERSQTRVRSSNGANGCQADANAAAHQQSANEPPLTSNLAGAKKVLVNGVSRAAKDVQEQSVGPD